MPQTLSIDNLKRHPQLLTMRDLCERLRLGRTTIYAVMRDDPSFPAPFRVVGNALRWDSADVESWISARKHAAGPVAALSSDVSSNADSEV